MKKGFLFSDKDLILLFIPLVLERFLEFSVGLMDSVMVSHIGEDAVSGVSLVVFVMQLLISFFAALCTGGAVIAGQYLGKKNHNKAREAANQMVWLVGLASIVIMVLVYSLKPLILFGLFGQISVYVREQADIYFNIVVASIPFLALMNGGAAIFRTMGNSKLPMKIMIVMNILNVFGNGLLIFGFGMGTGGIAVSTLVSRVLGALIMLFMAMNTKHLLYFEKSYRHRFDGEMIRKILLIGLPFGMERGLFFFGRLIVLTLISTFGTASIAANSIAGSISLFSVIIGLSVNLGMTTVISRCVGAGDIYQAKYYHRKILSWVYMSHLVLNSVIILLLPLILNFYNLSDLTRQLTMKLVIWHGVMAVLFWPLAYTKPVTFRAAGDAKFPLVVGTVSMFLFRIVMAYYLGRNLGLGVLGTYFAMFLDWIVKSIIFSIHYLQGKWQSINVV